MSNLYGVDRVIISKRWSFKFLLEDSVSIDDLDDLKFGANINYSDTVFLNFKFSELLPIIQSVIHVAISHFDSENLEFINTNGNRRKILVNDIMPIPKIIGPCIFPSAITESKDMTDLDKIKSVFEGYNPDGLNVDPVLSDLLSDFSFDEDSSLDVDAFNVYTDEFGVFNSNFVVENSSKKILNSSAVSMDMNFNISNLYKTLLEIFETPNGAFVYMYSSEYLSLLISKIINDEYILKNVVLTNENPTTFVQWEKFKNSNSKKRINYIHKVDKIYDGDAQHGAFVFNFYYTSSIDPFIL